MLFWILLSIRSTHTTMDPLPSPKVQPKDLPKVHICHSAEHLSEEAGNLIIHTARDAISYALLSSWAPRVVGVSDLYWFTATGQGVNSLLLSRAGLCRPWLHQSFCKKRITLRHCPLISVEFGSNCSADQNSSPVLSHTICPQWDKWEVFFADERYVSPDDKESNYWVCNDTIFRHVPIKQEQIHKIDHTKPLNECAAAYKVKRHSILSLSLSLSLWLANELLWKALRARMRLEPTVTHATRLMAYHTSLSHTHTTQQEELIKVFGQTTEPPQFDLILLGMGPDGHTCSLFPYHKLLEEREQWIAPISDSPKPPPQRITFTFPVVNNAHCVAFVVTGDSKKEVIAKVLEGKEDKLGTLLPAIVWEWKRESREIWFSDWFLCPPFFLLFKVRFLQNMCGPSQAIWIGFWTSQRLPCCRSILPRALANVYSYDNCLKATHSCVVEERT